MVLLTGDAQRPPEILGNKAYGIDAMRQHGLPVPPAFCITTTAGARYLTEPAQTMDVLWGDVLRGLRWLEAQTARTFGQGPTPLLVSVRSGAGQSLPGMMDTVLNVGMNTAVEQALATLGAPGWASDTRERFTQSYQAFVAPGSVPEDPYAQLRTAIEAVFGSWHSPRATAYRAHHGLPDSCGTAVVVQAMVFGNRTAKSGAGVLFSRNPITGASDPCGEWLPGGQGDDVVSGRVDAEPIATLPAGLPSVYEELVGAAHSLERLGADVQEIEFTVDDGTLWLLQTRVAKRSAQAAVRLALQLHDEGLIDDVEALRRVQPAHVATLLKPQLQPETRLAARLLATGMPACPGVATGRACIDVDEAVEAAERGEPVILVRSHTSPDDVVGMLAAGGIVTEVGGASSHAAVVSRELGRVAVVGCGPGVGAALAGKQITVDGNEGEVREGALECTAWSEGDSAELRRLAEIALRSSPLRAHASGEYPQLEQTTEAAIRAAMAAGQTDVVSNSPLIAMLTAVHLAAR